MHFIAVAIALLIGIPVSQGPEFTQQYEQRLGGAIDEIARVVQHFDEDSTRSGYDRAVALQIMRRNSESLVRNQAARMDSYISRLDRLRRQQTALQTSGPFARVVTVATDYDPLLASRTYDTFRWAFSIEGIVLSLVTSILIYLTTVLLAVPFRRRPSASV